MKLIELIIDEEAELFGIDAISLVEHPAIESDFLALKGEKIVLAEADADKRMLIGAALIPDKPIYRAQDGEDFHVYFSKRTVRRAMELFFKYGNQNNTTLEHEHKLNGLNVVESWIVESKENDKSSLYNLDVPVGTWMVSVKVENDAIWKDWVRSDKVKGFSIEGYFIDKMESQKREKMMTELTEILEENRGSAPKG
tara:strand:+ start:6710 stop:7300 length:591 start_codon:yes stop_codon:yes gene_type:complete